MNIRLKPVLFSAIVSAAFLGFMGCQGTKKEVKTEETPAVQETKEQAPAAASGMTIGTDWTSLDSLKDAYFDFDKADLRMDARDTLKANASVLQKLPRSVQIIVEGHCDQRGTTEYNLALGERRANAVKDYYAHAGITSGRLRTISYGKERSLCSDATEECWARNRRSATKVRNDEPVTVNF